MKDDNEDANKLAAVAEQPPLSPKREVVTFAPTVVDNDNDNDEHHDLFAPPVATHNTEMMGPILRRKKVVSVPLGAGGDFFVSDDVSGPHRQLFDDQGHHHGHATRVRQLSHTGHAAKVSHLDRQVTPPPPPTTTIPRRQRQGSGAGGGGGVIGGVLRRKQVSLDLLGPNDFFAAAPASMPPASDALLPVTPEGDVLLEEEPASGEEEKKLFRPLRFAPPMGARTQKQAGGGGHGAGAASSGHSGGGSISNGLPKIDEETSSALSNLSQANSDLSLQFSSFVNMLKDQGVESDSIRSFSERIQETQTKLSSHERVLQTKLSTATSSISSTSGGAVTASVHTSVEESNGDTNEETVKLMQDDDYYDDGIVRATRCDKIKTAVLFCIMLALTIIVCAWHTHLDEESFIQGPVGLACVTECFGNVETRDFFDGHNHFESGEVIQLTMHLDANEEAHTTEGHLIVEIFGTETNTSKSTTKFGPPRAEHREHLEEFVTVDFEDPEEAHVINVYSSDPENHLSFTLSAHPLTPLADHSELVAALIMVAVYFFILIEVIHRTLVAIFGAMIALMFFFIMHDGVTESIRQLMLHLQWSTFGLLFGMMLLVGELSHTGMFEWCAVSLLVASKGSFVRLMVLLCTLTAIASAFLDNVTTMLLVAPVTIDMCNILDVDPRPYLIGEVLLSNIGGTATLIGDPPNIIIGSSFDEIGFVDFIIHVLPCIFVVCLPISIVVVCWIYRHYLTTSKMRVLDTAKLKQTYPIYDEPRLMIAGTSTFFVILMFFLHPVHHKDTAWIALLGAFITIAFTNPHDVQEALRSHVEWDTLLFFAGLFVLVEVCAAMGLLKLIGDGLATYIEAQPEENQLTVAITLIIWVSAITSAFLDNIPYTATMIPIIQILSDELPDTLPIETLAWALSFGACLGGNGTLLGASANIVTAGISTNKGFEISFLNFLYPGMICMFVTVAIANLYMLIRYVWI